MLDAFPVRCQVGNCVLLPVRILGAGAANPTLEVGPGVTATWVSQGKYRIATKDYVGKLVGVLAQFGQAAGAAGGTNVVSWDHDSYTATSKALDIFVEDPGTEAVAPALADLAATDKLFLLLVFNQGGPVK
jgi:hypothetical protein